MCRRLLGRAWKGELHKPAPSNRALWHTQHERQDSFWNFSEAISLLSFNTYADLIKNCRQRAKENIPTLQSDNGFTFSS